MQSTACPFYFACRFQQAIVAKLKDQGEPSVPCWADTVTCDDQKPDMEKRCSHWANLRSHMAAIQCERIPDGKSNDGNRRNGKPRALLAGILVLAMGQIVACAPQKAVVPVPDRCDSQECNVGTPPL
jgi:hypothetical protein